MQGYPLIDCFLPPAARSPVNSQPRVVRSIIRIAPRPPRRPRFPVRRDIDRRRGPGHIARPDQVPPLGNDGHKCSAPNDERDRGASCAGRLRHHAMPVAIAEVDHRPMTSQTTSRNQVASGIRASVAAKILRRAWHYGTPGVRKGRFVLGELRRRWITATHTSRNANSVPMLTISPSSPIGKAAAINATTNRSTPDWRTACGNSDALC